MKTKSLFFFIFIGSMFETKHIRHPKVSRTVLSAHHSGHRPNILGNERNRDVIISENFSRSDHLKRRSRDFDDSDSYICENDSECSSNDDSEMCDHYVVSPLKSDVLIKNKNREN